MRVFLQNHKIFEAVIGYLLFFGGYTFVMIMAARIGDYLDRKIEEREKEK